MLLQHHVATLLDPTIPDGWEEEMEKAEAGLLEGEAVKGGKRRKKRHWKGKGKEKEETKHSEEEEAESDPGEDDDTEDHIDASEHTELIESSDDSDEFSP